MPRATVAQEVAGSKPVTHPKQSDYRLRTTDCWPPAALDSRLILGKPTAAMLLWALSVGL